MQATGAYDLINAEVISAQDAYICCNIYEMVCKLDQMIEEFGSERGKLHAVTGILASLASENI